MIVQTPLIIATFKPAPLSFPLPPFDPLGPFDPELPVALGPLVETNFVVTKPLEVFAPDEVETTVEAFRVRGVICGLL